MRELADSVILAQGGYYLATGLWPILSAKSFQWITGPKRDVWLVKTFGALVAAVSVPLLIAGSRGEISTEALALGIGAAAALGIADVVYALKRVISPIYLADAAAEALLLSGYLAAAL